ncbi:acyl transferase [Aquiflexum sp.]|uniref:acyl transferase n=1 Tax=Aquiflexum sp. TaxID=1872584 RepID=UPI0035946234
MTNNTTINYFKSFGQRILSHDFIDFEEFALEIFRFQALNNFVYRKYLDARKIQISDVRQLDHIPFLPISFFKNHNVISSGIQDFKGFYSSSGTTGNTTSKHYFWDEAFYLKHAQQLFEMEYGPVENFHILALLPSYLERPGSSLVRMTDHLIQQSNSPHSGYYLYNHKELIQKLEELKNDPKKVLLLGVTFALLDLAESGLKIPLNKNFFLMETGGMKGRRRELIREELHDILKEAFHVKEVHSEYGMTELMSQAYSKGNGKYNLPSTMRVLLRDINDPFSLTFRSQGGINIIDLANFHSCAFLETQDLGKITPDGSIEVLGRFDNSEIRGCNLMVN